MTTLIGLGTGVVTGEPIPADQDETARRPLATAWEAVSQNILRDRRTDVGAMIDYATAVLREAAVVPRTLEIGFPDILGIELLDDDLGMAGRLRTRGLRDLALGGGSTVYLVTRINRDPTLEQPVRCEIDVRWGDDGAVTIHMAVFSQLTDAELFALKASETGQFGGYEYTVGFVRSRPETDPSPHLARVNASDLWHPHQNSHDAWVEEPPAGPLIEKTRALMQAAVERFDRIQDGLRFD